MEVSDCIIGLLNNVMRHASTTGAWCSFEYAYKLLYTNFSIQIL